MSKSTPIASIGVNMAPSSGFPLSSEAFPQGNQKNSKGASIPIKLNCELSREALEKSLPFLGILSGICLIIGGVAAIIKPYGIGFLALGFIMLCFEAPKLIHRILKRSILVLESNFYE